MDETLSPDEALGIAADMRHAAATPGVPAWLPVYAGTTFALGMALLGVSDMAGGGSAARLWGIAAAVVLVAHLGAYVGLLRRWRRGGLVPLTDAGARRRVSTACLVVACAAGGAFSMAGSVGWGTICFGVIIGTETWYRISGWVRTQ